MANNGNLLTNNTNLIAPPGKIQSTFLLSSNNANNTGGGGLLKSSSSGIGLSSSIFNLPVFSTQDANGAVLQPTQRGLKPIETSNGKLSAKQSSALSSSNHQSASVADEN